MLEASDRILSVASLPKASVEERLEAAATAGFRGVSLWTDDACSLARSAGTIRAGAAEHGLEVACIEAALRWVSPDEAAEEALGLAALCDSAGTRSLLACALPDRSYDADAAVRGFEILCDGLAHGGVSVCLEFLPWSPIACLADAWHVVESAGRENGKLMLDTFHWYRTGSRLDLLPSIPGEKIQHVQLCDASPEPIGEVAHEAMHDRLLPGAGGADIGALLRCVMQTGAQPPLTIEVFNDTLMALPVGIAAARLFEALEKSASAAGYPS
jgi:sugar phosphate isomerase/epimerase